MNLNLFNFRKKKESKNQSSQLNANEVSILYNDVETIFMNISPEFLTTERPINFDIFLHIRKSEKLLHYFRNGHLFTSEEINKLKVKASENLLILKEDKNKLFEYIEPAPVKKIKHEDFVEALPVKKIKNDDYIAPPPAQKSKNEVATIKPTNASVKESPLVISGHENKAVSKGWDCINDAKSRMFVEVINSLNQISENQDTYEEIKTILDNANDSSYNVYQLMLENLPEEHGKLPISKMVMLENPISRLFFLALFFSLKNKIRDKNVLFHSVINILDDQLSEHARKYYDRYWSELADIHGVSIEALINIGDAIQYSKQFESIIENFIPIFEEEGYNNSDNKKNIKFNI